MAIGPAILIPIAVMNGFIMLILLLISLLKRFIAVYGEYQLTINGDKTFTVAGGKPLSQTLFEEKIYIPSACGGRGTCGFCLLKR
jgi:Na+-transporting NADH:ubiquinone oxidoreductase subunit F